MFDPSMMAAPMPPVDPAMLAAGGSPAPGGAAPVPLPPGAGDPMGGMPPELAALLGGGGADPMMGGEAPMDPMGGGQNPYPTADPNFMSEVLGQIVQMRQMDAGKLAADQEAAMIGNPMFEALMSGAPLGPGAGQDGQALGAPSMEMPTPDALAGMGGMGY